VTPEELAACQENTVAFIAADPVSIVLTPVAGTSDGRGGTKRSWPVAGILPAQTFRLIPRSSANDKVREVQGSDGRVAAVEFVIMGVGSSTMTRFDRFSWGTHTWEIAQIHDRTSTYERKGDVIQVG
jgi:hypothetical protein